jgi:hypothetical protein
MPIKEEGYWIASWLHDFLYHTWSSILSYLSNWVSLIFGKNATLIMMIQHTKFEQNPVHGFQGKYKMVVGDDGSFLEKYGMDSFEIFKVYSSYLSSSPLQMLWTMDT